MSQILNVDKPKCENCNRILSCNCQKRIASDGAQCCSKCVDAYQNALKQKQ